MPNKEIPLQFNFSGELIDDRTRRQKRADRLAAGWQQAEMFAQRDLAQFGVRARSEMSAVTIHGEALKMELEIQDPRSAEEQEADRQRAAEELTDPLFEQAQPGQADSP